MSRQFETPSPLPERKSLATPIMHQQRHLTVKRVTNRNIEWPTANHAEKVIRSRKIVAATMYSLLHTKIQRIFRTKLKVSNA